MDAPPPLIVVMGVSGSGKTTVGTALAARLRVAYIEGDDFHSASNVAKMASGTPLDDADRLPWLRSLAAALRERRGEGVVLSCSALRRPYRDLLAGAAPGLIFLHLVVPAAVLRERLRARTGHFMSPSLLDSQLAALEPLGPTERGVALDAARPVGTVVDDFARWLADQQA
jgi:gluconokinase